jgi:hypothetical protein
MEQRGVQFLMAELCLRIHSRKQNLTKLNNKLCRFKIKLTNLVFDKIQILN